MTYIVVDELLIRVLLDAISDSEVTSIVSITKFHVLELFNEVVVAVCMLRVDIVPCGGAMFRFHDDDSSSLEGLLVEEEWRKKKNKELQSIKPIIDWPFTWLYR